MKIIFTKHTEEQIKIRRISKQEVIDALGYPDKISKKHAKLFYQKNIGRGIIEVCCQKMQENELIIITVYWL